MMTYMKALRKLICYPAAPLICLCKMGQQNLESFLKHLHFVEENARKPNHFHIIQYNILLFTTPIIMGLFPLHQSFT